MYMNKNKRAAAVFIILITLVTANVFAQDYGPVKYSEYDVQFGLNPLHIEKAELLPNGSILVIYFAQIKNIDKEIYQIDLLIPQDKQVFTKKLLTFIPENHIVPSAQITIKSNSFTCELFHDVAAMETSLVYEYSFDGRLIEEHKKNYKLGQASYVQNIGNFTLKRQAHLFDEIDASAYYSLEIEHMPTGKKTQTKIWDTGFAASADTEKDLLYIVQFNEQNQIELREYSAKDALQENIYLLNYPGVASYQSIIGLAVSNAQDIFYVLLNKENTVNNLLAYDKTSKELIIDRNIAALPDASYMSGLIGSEHYLLAVNECWQESSQTYSKKPGIITSAPEQLPLDIKAEALILDETDNEFICIEKNQDSSNWRLTKYIFNSLQHAY